jgi:hypothetical protein
MGFANTNVLELTDRAIIREYLMTVPVAEWTTARTLSNWTGLSTRAIRQVAQDYPTLLVTGQRGYKLAAYADRRELQETVHHLLSRAQKLMERASHISDYALSK